MNRTTFWLIAAAMFAIGTAVRVNNALVFSPVRSYDGYAHFSYIWFMAEHWRVPLSTAGWEFFQPPLYYAFMAWVWNVLAPVDPILRLRLGTLAIALLGLSNAVISAAMVRRYLPGNRLAALLAAGLMLFLPVHLYSAGFLGNEYLSAIFCSISLLALLWLLRKPTATRAIVLGLCLGLAMLSKFTGVVVVAGAFATIGGRALVRDRWQNGLRIGVIAGVAMLSVCGWYYARNVYLYGTPFKMSRETFLLQRYEHLQAKGRRGILEYVLFDPVILRRPQWPRGAPLNQEHPPDYQYSAARESVLTGLYANAWFDGYGGWVLPSVTQNEAVRRSGQALLTLGLVPSILVLAGLARAMRRLWRYGWDDTLVAMLTTFGAMVAVLVQGTHSVPTHAAVKATYLLPVSVIFGFWFAFGADWLRIRHPRLLKGAVAACVLLAAISSTVFLQGRVIARDWFDEEHAAPLWRNIYGVVYRAGGDSERARQYFQGVADENYHLGFENLSVLALEEGRPLEALYDLRRAAQLQPFQSLGTPADKALFNQLTRAEYLNTMAVIYHQLGWNAEADEAASQAVAADRQMPEANYDLAVLRLSSAVLGNGVRDQAVRWAGIQQSRKLVFSALVLDPGMAEARALGSTLEALDGNCDEAARQAEALGDFHGHRAYPVDTGIGDMLASSVRRRRHITALPEALTPQFQVPRCYAEAKGHGA